MRKDGDLPTSVADSGPAVSTSVEGAPASEGPWEVGYGRGITGPRSAATAYLSDQPKIVVSAPGPMNYSKAVCFVTGSDGHESADARLIAAAPDLLAAVKELLADEGEWFTEHPDTYAERLGDSLGKSIYRSRWMKRERARAAIAKATGAQP
jgi:hypothetical protein